MSGLFGTPKTPTPPTPKPPPPPPRVDTDQVGTEARKRRGRGFEETFLTGDLVPEVDVNKNLKRRFA